MKLSAEEFALFNSMTECVLSMSGVNGTKIHAGTADNTGLAYKAVSIRADSTAFTSLTMTGDGADLDETYFLIGSPVLLKGDLLVAPKGYIITQFKLSAGSLSGSLAV